MSKRRLFVAIPVPELIKEEIHKQLNTLNLPLKWIPEKNLHVTAHFFGNIEEEYLDELFKKISDVCKEVSSLVLEPEMISVKSGKFQNMIWVKFKRSQAFEDLCKEISKKFDVEVKRNPLPHINLVRSRSKITSDKFPIPFNKTFQLNVSAIELWESKLSPQGSTYSSLKSFILKGEKDEKKR
jgi:RNA 2',3'-cyclic 3'-phosphodiesterase